MYRIKFMEVRYLCQKKRKITTTIIITTITKIIITITTTIIIINCNRTKRSRPRKTLKNMIKTAKSLAIMECNHNS